MGNSSWTEVVSIALGSVILPDEDAELIKQAQRTAIMRDPTMAAATLVGAHADAMKTAAGNEAGAMTGFMGMGMAMNAAGGGMNAQNLLLWDSNSRLSRQHSSRLHRICSRHPGQEHGNVNVVQRIQENSALNVVNRNRSGKSGYAAAAQ